MPARCEAVLPKVATEVRFEFVNAEGGRLCESSRCRGVMPDVLGTLPGWKFVVGALPGRLFDVGALPGRKFDVGALCDGALGVMEC